MSVQVKQLTKQYGAQIAVNQINFKLKKGEITGFLGPNGAGKSTTMKMITGSLVPTSGEIEINGVNILKNPISAQKNIGYLPEHNPLYLEMYVREYLRFMADLYGNISKNRIEEIIEITGLTPESNKKIEQLSKGYRQRVGLASALIHNPEILILDEPTVGIDPALRLQIWEELRRQQANQKTILMTMHVMDEAERVDRVVLLFDGRIIADDSPAALKAQYDVATVEQVFLKAEVEATR